MLFTPLVLQLIRFAGALGGGMSAATLASILSNALLLPRWPASSRALKTPTTLAQALSTAAPRLRRRRCDKDLFYVSKKKPSVFRSSTAEVAAETAVARSDRYPDYCRLLPCPLQNDAPRVEHLVVSEGGVVLDYICKALNLPPLYVADLIHFGAVFYALVCPKPPPSATAEEVRIFREVTDPLVLLKRSSIKGKTVREAQKTFRITDANQFLETGTYLRVHVHPKRFPSVASCGVWHKLSVFEISGQKHCFILWFVSNFIDIRCYEIDWKSRIIAVTDSYVILDKPAATTVGGTTDNIEESCATFASRALGLESHLILTHQIDNCTEGCVVLSRTKNFCSLFHGMIREKQVKKLYLALAAAPVPIGVLSHYMRPVNLAPRLVSEDSIAGWHLCQLEVLECREIPWPNAAVVEGYKIEDCGWPSQSSAYECQINLLTGKTHQIRTQLASVGAPIIGDSMYMPAALAEMAVPNINPFGSRRKHYTSEDEKMADVEEWITRHGKEPNAGIGLQASQISWDDGKCFYEAGVPWWRRGTA